MLDLTFISIFGVFKLELGPVPAVMGSLLRTVIVRELFHQLSCVLLQFLGYRALGHEL